MQQHKNDIFNGSLFQTEWHQPASRVEAAAFQSLHASAESLLFGTPRPATCVAVTDAAHVSPSPTAAAHLSAVF